VSAELCCGGYCRRKHPPRLMRGGLTGRWYIVTRYKDLGDGNYEATEKHELDAKSVQYLNAMAEVYAASTGAR
jgi:hypothetical protein